VTSGLVLGKFAPLHRGHQHLIECALQQVDQLHVLVYDAPSVTMIPLSVRAKWIRRLYPAAVVIEGRGAPEAAGSSAEVMRLQEDYILSIVPSKITHFFSGEWYGDHVSRALQAIHVRLDRGRLPVTGGQVRQDPFACRMQVHPLVYRDLVRRVVLLGAESTGKSSLAEALARRLSTVLVPEHGREFWIDHHDSRGLLSAQQLVTLAGIHHAAAESATLEARTVLVMDTDARTTAQYARWYHGAVPAELERHAAEAASEAALTVLCGDDIPYVDDGTRAGENRRRQAQREIKDGLERSGVIWMEATGSIANRVEQVVSALETRKILPWY
jgi:NadR type nicotinamide-nucleotide adenylyltransferase